MTLGPRIPIDVMGQGTGCFYKPGRSHTDSEPSSVIQDLYVVLKRQEALTPGVLAPGD